MKKVDYERIKDLELDRNSIRLAEVRYYYKNGDRGYTEIRNEKDKVYVFLLKMGNQYINIFTEEEYPVYDRGYEKSMTLSGEQFGNKIKLVAGEEKEGLCYVIDPMSVMDDRFFGKDKYRVEEIVDYMMYSPKFFVDRIGIIKNKLVSFNFEVIRIILNDYRKINNFNKYLDSIGTGYQYRKK